MRMRLPLVVSLILIAGLLVGGCSEPLLGPSGSARSNVKIQGLTPEQLGTVGAKLQMHPDRQQETLKAYELSLSEFEQAIETISEDPALSRRYRRAYEAELNR